MNHYTTSRAGQLFGVTEQTIKTWAAEVSQYLSVGATPEKGKKRRFSREDMEIFALIAQMRNQGLNFDEIHIALKNGQRGELPLGADESPADAPIVISQLRQEVDAMRGMLTALQNDKSERDGQIKLLKEQLAEKDAEIRRLYRDLARHEAKENPDG